MRPRAVPVERGEQFEVLAGAQVGVEAGRLDEAGDALERARALAHRIAPEQLDAALGRRDQPERHAQVVVLPAPFGPRNPYTSPLRTFRSMWSTARTSL